MLKRLYGISKPAVSPVAAGLLHAAAFSVADTAIAPFGWMLQSLALAWFFHLLFAQPQAASTHTTTPLGLRHIAGRTWLFCCVWLMGTVYWLSVSMFMHGHLPLWLALFFVCLFCAALALYYVLAMVAAAWILRAGADRAGAPLGGPLRIVVLALCWLLAEMARGTWFTGFPWGAIAYAHTDSPLAILAPWLGVYGVAGAAAALAATLAQYAPWLHARPATAVAELSAGSLWRRWRVMLACVTLLCVLVVLPRPSFTQESGTLSVQLTQSNLPLLRDFDLRNRLSLQWLARVLPPQNTATTHAAALIVTPETSFPDLADRLPAGWWLWQQQQLAERNQSAIIGAIWPHAGRGYSNAAFLMGAAAVTLPSQPNDLAMDNAPRYEKSHLVPFGEFVPPLFRWFVDAVSIPMADFLPGTLPAPVFYVQQQRIGLTICYEDLFGEELAARFLDEKRAPTLFVNTSNLGWFATPGFITTVLGQHREIARMRSLEFERASLRSTNTGATVHIDHRGRVLASMPYYREGSLDVQAQGRLGLTLYAWWAARWGLWPLGIGAVCMLLIAAWFSARNRRRTH